MGKKGELLRLQKAQNSRYTFTSEQLLAHDMEVRKECIERARGKMHEEVLKAIEKEWAEREKMLKGEAPDVEARVFSMLVSIPCRILVRDFGWTPIHNNGHAERTKLARFMTAVQTEAEDIINDEKQDIRVYAEKVYDEVGIKLEPEEDDHDC